MAVQRQHYQDKLRYEIDSWDLKEAIVAGEQVVVVDARSHQAYEAKHIPTAVSLPHRTMAAADMSFIPRDALVVVYCDGIGCNASTKGALNMLDLGFRVKELMGGLDWWERDGHPVCSGRKPGGFGEEKSPATATA